MEFSKPSIKPLVFKGGTPFLTFLGAPRPGCRFSGRSLFNCMLRLSSCFMCCASVYADYQNFNFLSISKSVSLSSSANCRSVEVAIV